MPLMPWFFTRGLAGAIWSLALTATAALFVGAYVSRSAGMAPMERRPAPIPDCARCCRRHLRHRQTRRYRHRLTRREPNAAYRHKSWTWPARSPGSSDAHQVRVLRTQVDEHCDREADRVERDETDIGPGAATSAAWACERKIVGIIL